MDVFPADNNGPGGANNNNNNNNGAGGVNNNNNNNNNNNGFVQPQQFTSDPGTLGPSAAPNTPPPQRECFPLIPVSGMLLVFILACVCKH